MPVEKPQRVVGATAKSCLMNLPKIGPAGDLVVVWYTGYPDCKEKARN